MKRFLAVILFAVMLIGGMGGMTGAMASGEIGFGKVFDIEHGNSGEEVTYSLDGKYTAPEIGKIRPFAEGRLDFGSSINEYVSGKYKLGIEADATDTFTFGTDVGKVFEPNDSENFEFNVKGDFEINNGVNLRTAYRYNEYSDNTDSKKIEVKIVKKFK